MTRAAVLPPLSYISIIILPITVISYAFSEFAVLRKRSAVLVVCAILPRHFFPVFAICSSLFNVGTQTDYIRELRDYYLYARFIVCIGDA
jgi:hypothetical protein